MSFENGYNQLQITGIEKNLTFSEEEVWAWYLLPVPETDYGVYPEEAGLPKLLKENLIRLKTLAKKKKLQLHLLVSTHEAGVEPIVTVGIKLGNRKDKGETFLPKSFQKLINTLADAPLNDYISEEDIEFWDKKASPYNQYFGANLGFKLTTSGQLAYMVRKRFYPSMSIPRLLPEAEEKERWGQFNIAELAKGLITPYPKFLQITQDIGTEMVTGYKSGIEIIKYNTETEYPEFETWLPYVKAYPYIVDFSIRFNVTDKGYENIVTRLSLEAKNTEDLIERTEDLLHHYSENDMYAVWTTGDQVALLNESIPNGKNFDAVARPKKSELSINYIKDNLTFSKNDVYVWVKIPLVQFEYLDDEAKENLALNGNSALTSLVTSEDKNVECHMIIQGSPFDARGWVQELNEAISSDDPLYHSREYLTEMYNYVDSADFRERTVLLGVSLGKRANYSPNKSASPTVLETVLNVIPPIITEEVSEKEFDYWKVLARQITAQLENSRIEAEAANPTELAFAIRKNFFPDMPLPTPKDLALGNEYEWKNDELDYLADASIENNPRYLKITQLIDGKLVTGYRATLCFSRFPEIMYFPQGEPWIHSASLLPFPTDFSLRFTLEPARKVRKEVGNKLKEVVDQAVNMESAGGNASIEVREQIETGEDLDYALKKDPSPWVYGRYRITVEASTVEELKERAKQIIDHYRGIEIYVTWPTGDQLALFKEGLPNDKVRSTSYYQRHVLSGISAGIPAGTGTAGDNIVWTPEGEQRGWVGPYIGRTTGQTEEPVFLSMHSTIDTNNSNGIVITGSPGSGKTFCALTLTYQTVLSGAWTIYIDPKADAQNIATLQGIQNNSRVIDLRDGNVGLLDPFSIGVGISQQKELAIEVINLFMGGSDKISAEQRAQLANAFNAVTKFRDPSLGKIVDYLVNNKNYDAKSLGIQLETISTLPFAQLCFSPSTSETTKLRAEDGLTILTLLGLELPGADTDRDSYTNANKLAVGVMYLLCSFTRELMLSADKRHAKAIIVDEAWAITSTKQGQKLINEVARMGRAHNTYLMLISQNAEDFNGESVTNSVSTRLAFRANDPEAIKQTLTFLELEHSDSNKDTIRNLNTGECLLKDWKGRIARVQIDSWNKDLRKALETNPRAKADNN